MTKLLNNLSERSQIAIAKDCTRYEAWCNARNLTPIPASADQVEAWLTDCVNEGLKLATIKRFIYSIGLAHAMEGFISPTKLPTWRSHWSRIFLKLQALGTTHAVERNELNADNIRIILASLGDSPRELRDAALLTVASDTLYKAGELVTVCAEYITAFRDGSGQLRLPQPPDLQGSFHGVRYLSTGTMYHVRRWCDAMNIRSGPLFLAIGGRPKEGQAGFATVLEPREIGRIFRRRAKAAGLEGAFSSYSTRLGAALDLVRAGATVREVQSAGGWRTPHVIAERTRDIEGTTEALQKLHGKQ